MSSPKDRQQLLKAGRLADVIERKLKDRGVRLTDVPSFPDFIGRIPQQEWERLVADANKLRQAGEPMHHDPSPECRALVAQRLAERAKLDALSLEELFAGLS
jgi:hypothetical protein